MKINIIFLIKYIVKLIILFTLSYVLLHILSNNKLNLNNQINKQYVLLSIIFSFVILILSSFYKKEKFDDLENETKEIDTTASNDDTAEEIKEEIIADNMQEVEKEITDDGGIILNRNNETSTDIKTDIKTEELNDKDKTLIAEYEDTINKIETNPAYRSNDNIITDENIYDQYGGGLNANSLYIPRDYKLADPLDAQYYQIPPQYWVGGSFGMVQPPVCSPANGRCKISNICTSGYPSNNVEVNYVPLKNFYEATKVLGPDGINVKYIEDKLNTAH